MKRVDTALEASFENPEAFSRAFKRVFSQSPAQYYHSNYYNFTPSSRLKPRS
ncbi:AraC family transcriptional regulator [Pseudoalteromonas arctica]|uniref:AraC family transcriptional regulator n=1 Tax=Pseudoalteromonas arctica TaxID=394751 RepID=A0A7Y0HCN9_9GAMM|nr:AraC family transcriptional regulator [Pseudoalteromonas arctica]NMM41588.1 AraC family transcriptional regulator [Pseudoalteromonas arctica]